MIDFVVEVSKFKLHYCALVQWSSSYSSLTEPRFTRRTTRSAVRWPLTSEFSSWRSTVDRFSELKMKRPIIINIPYKLNDFWGNKIEIQQAAYVFNLVKLTIKLHMSLLYENSDEFGIFTSSTNELCYKCSSNTLLMKREVFLDYCILP